MSGQVAGLWLIALGGASNLLERIVWGQITDYWHVGRLEFNLADVAIVAGAILVIYFLYACPFALGRPSRHRGDSR